MEKKNSVAGGKSGSVLRILLLTALGMTVACAAAAPFIRFGLMNLRDAQRGAAFFCFLLAEFIFFMGSWFSGILLSEGFSRRSYLLADEERLDARTARGEEIHLPLSSVTDAEVFMDTLYLYEGKTVHVINGLDNVREIRDFLLARIEVRPYIPSPEEAMSAFTRCRRRFRLYTAGAVLGILGAVGMTAWVAAAMTGGVSGIFTPLDILLFLAFLLAEGGAVLLTVFLLVRSVCVRFSMQYSERHLTSSLAYPHRQEDLERFPNRTETKYFDRYIYRIVVAEGGALWEPEEPEEEKDPPACSYVLQQFRPEYGRWRICRCCDFDSWEELYDDLAGTFDDAVFLP